MKRCSKCGIEKGLSSFYKRSYATDGKMSHCKKCKNESIYSWREKNAEHLRAYHRERYRKYELNGKGKRLPSRQPERRAIHRRRHRYGVTEAQYNAMMAGQDKKCAICKMRFTCGKYPTIDHCHITGKVRGLLCGICNTSIGGFRDNIGIVKSALEYLRQARQAKKLKGAA